MARTALRVGTAHETVTRTTLDHYGAPPKEPSKAILRNNLTRLRLTSETKIALEGDFKALFSRVSSSTF